MVYEKNTSGEKDLKARFRRRAIGASILINYEPFKMLIYGETLVRVLFWKSY